MMKCSAVRAISLIRCDETNTVRPSAASSFSRLRIQRIPFGIEPVDRLVEHDGLGIAEQCGGDPEPLAHAQREPACGPVGDLVEADDAQHLVDPPVRNSGGGGESPEVVAGRPLQVYGLGLEERADLGERCGVIRELTAVDSGATLARIVEAEDHAHRGRLPGAVRPEEACDDPRADGEAQVVDRDRLAVALGE
jgi:hypothetical protein